MKYEAAPANITNQLTAILKQIALRNVDVADTTSPFFSTAPPTISLDDYLSRMHQYMFCSMEAYVLASVLITRLEEASRKSIVSPGSVHRLVLTATVVAAKMNDDAFLDNRHYADVGGISLAEMNRLELYLLQQLSFRVFVSPEQYNTCLASMESLYALITNTASTAAINNAQRLRRSSSVMDAVVEDVMSANTRLSPSETDNGRRSSASQTEMLEEFAFGPVAPASRSSRRASFVNAQ